MAIVFQLLYSDYGLLESAVAMVFQSLQWQWFFRVCCSYRLPESAVAMVFQSLL